jgi:hypothetical protein
MKITSTPLVSTRDSRCSMPAGPGLATRVVLFGGLLLLGLACLTGRVSGQGLVPELLAIQGYMEDGSGAPLGPSSPVNYPVVFRIFGAPTGGTATWSERQTVTFDKGNYSVLLGQGAVNGAEPRPNLSSVVLNAAGSTLFVEATVTINGTDAKILPRLQLLPTPYAFLASKALTVDGAAVVSGTIADDRLTPALRNYITNGPVADSQLSASLINTINNGAIADARLSAGLRNYITNGPVADSQLSPSLINTINNGLIADTRLSGNIARRNTANSFAGDQTISGNATITGNLTVQSSLNVGNLGQFKVASGEESLRIVRGQVRLTPRQAFPTGAVPLAGTGFTVQRVPNYQPAGAAAVMPAVYEITFTTPFSGVPSVTVNAVRDFDSGGFGVLTGWQEAWSGGRVELTTPTRAIVAFQWDGYQSVELPFSFIAVGPR